MGVTGWGMQLKNCEVERRMGELQAAVKKLQLEKDALGSKADMLERALLHEDRVNSASLVCTLASRLLSVMSL